MDVAALALKVDSSEVVKAANDLDRLGKASTAAGNSSAASSGSIARLVASVQSMNSKLGSVVSLLEKTAAANDNVSTSAARTASEITSIARAADQADAHVKAFRSQMTAMPTVLQQADSHVIAYRNSLKNVGEEAVRAGAAIKFTATDSLNATRQLADIGTTLAMGMSPFMIAIQQGPQLLDILQNKAAMTGQTLGAVFRAAAGSIAAALAPFAPLIAAVGLLAAGFVALRAEANDDSGLKKYTTAMGYTKAEVEKLNSVTVTFGDTVKATFQVAMKSAAEAIGIGTDQMAATWGKFLDYLARGTKATLAGIYAGLAGTRYYLAEIGKGGVTGLAKMAIGQGDPNLLKNTYGKAYQEGQDALNRIVDQARKNAQTRQTEMAKAFYDAPKTPKVPKATGPKAFTYDDLMKDADKYRNDLTKQAAQIGIYGEALAKVTYEQDLLNKASERGLKLSPAQKDAIAGIAAELAKLSEANRAARFMTDFGQQTDQQIASLTQARGAIGLTAGALAAYTYEQEQLNKAIADHIKLSDADKQKIHDDAARVGAATTTNTTEAAQDAGFRAHNQRMRQLEAERGALGLTGKALVSYNYQQAEITRQLQSGVQFADLNIETIRRQGDAYARVSTAIDQQRQAIADARDATKGFFSDWINGARQGQNVFTSFANSAINALNRLIDKLLDKTLNSFLDSMFQGGNSAGDFLTRLFGGGGMTRSSFEAGRVGLATPNALGGVYGAAQRFANGGVFTNQVITDPTLFRFANGGKFGLMGEAGPEAVMPLKRGPNGSLGVQMHGGSGKRPIEIHVHNNNSFAGAIGPESIAAMNQQVGEATYRQLKRDLPMIIQTYDRDGTVVS